ncbi:flagellar protein FlaG [Methylorubrum populi]|uniref:Flagellar protein FlaG n=1 Tax=Methylorubrum populi TaxID=223967 RepID=A0A921E272_9HYPH|nr:flagellar protein FlaG [Methylorubrum populi]
MDPIRPAASISPVSTSPILPLRPVTDGTRSDTQTSRTLDPAVSLDVKPEAAEAKLPDSERRAYVRDADSQSLVFRVTDSQTGEVVMQIPDEIVLKARVYAREAYVPTGERVAKTA